MDSCWLRARCTGFAVCICLILTNSVLGQWNVVPGPYPDRDKPHDEAAHVNTGSSWGNNYYEDTTVENDHWDPNEAISDSNPNDTGWNYSKKGDPDWGNLEASSDNSCWLASADNLTVYLYGHSYYNLWAYDYGVDGSGATPYSAQLTSPGDNPHYPQVYWIDGGFQHMALEQQGIPTSVMAADIHCIDGTTLYSSRDFVDPVGFLSANFREGVPVGVGFFGNLDPNLWGHAITLYGINTQTQEIRFADSDCDPNLFDITYELGTDEVMRINYDGGVQQLAYMATADIVAWWTGGTGSWTAGGNWASESDPHEHSLVYLTQNNLGVATVDGSATAQRIIIDSDSLSKGMAIDGAGSLNVSGSVIVGEAGKGGVSQSGGSLAVAGIVTLGSLDGSHGQYEMTLGTFNCSVLNVGGAGDGTLKVQGGDANASAWIKVAAESTSDGEIIQTGGKVKTDGDVWIGYEGKGSYKLSGTGQLDAKNENFGSDANANGTFTQNGGTNTVSQYLRIGHASQSEGTYAMTDGSLSAGYVIVGNSGQGEFTQSGGDVTVGNDMFLGFAGGAEGTYELTAGTVDVAKNLVVSNEGLALGELLVKGGQFKVRSATYVGYAGGSYGTLKISNPSAVFQSYTLYVGKGGKGTVVQQNGSVKLQTAYGVAGYLYVGNDQASEGAYTLADGSISARSIGVGVSGTGTIEQSGGTVTASMLMYVGQNASGIGTYKLSGGVLDLTGSSQWEDVGHNGTGRFEQSGGTHNVCELHIGSSANSSGTYVLSDGALSAHRIEVAYRGSGTFEQTGGTITVNDGVAVGHHLGSHGSYSLSGGLLEAKVSVGVGPVATGGPVLGTFELNGTGQLVADMLVVGLEGSGEFTQTGGTAKVSQVCAIGQYPGAEGTYTFAGGTLTFTDGSSTGGLSVGDRGIGTLRIEGGTLSGYWEHVAISSGGQGQIIQTAGTHTAQNLNLGMADGADGTYTMSGGSYELDYMLAGANKGTGTFTQDGGTVRSNWSDIGYNDQGTGAMRIENGSFWGNIFVLGRHAGSVGRLDVDGGACEIGTLVVGESGHGTLSINSDTADFKVFEKLVFGPDSSLSIASNTTIHMTGSGFQIQEGAEGFELCDLDKLTLLFEGGSTHNDGLELAGKDCGLSMAGFVNNFALDCLVLGGDDVGFVHLRDDWDNNADGAGNDVLYVRELVLGAGSQLDLCGRTVYYQSMTDLGTTIIENSGQLLQIPEPSVLGILVAGLNVIVFRRRRNN